MRVSLGNFDLHFCPGYLHLVDLFNFGHVRLVLGDIQLAFLYPASLLGRLKSSRFFTQSIDTVAICRLDVRGSCLAYSLVDEFLGSHQFLNPLRCLLLVEHEVLGQELFELFRLKCYKVKQSGRHLPVLNSR